ncbi:UNVERIFIED_CONTAM: hypothetical protein NY100_34480, partial [Prevotella sp. 15_C9]
AHYSIDNGKTFSEPEPVIGIMERLCKQSYKGQLQLHFDVNVEQQLSKASLVVESPFMYQSIQINDKNINSFNEEA